MVHNKTAGQDDKKPVVTIPLPTQLLPPSMASGPRQQPWQVHSRGGESRRCDRADSTGTGTWPTANVSTQQLLTRAEMSSLLRSAHKGIPRRKR